MINYNNNLVRLQNQYHKNCLFNSDEFNTEYFFNGDGSFVLNFFCSNKIRVMMK